MPSRPKLVWVPHSRSLFFAMTVVYCLHGTLGLAASDINEILSTKCEKWSVGLQDRIETTMAAANRSNDAESIDFAKRNNLTPVDNIVHNGKGNSVVAELLAPDTLVEPKLGIDAATGKPEFKFGTLYTFKSRRGRGVAFSGGTLHMTLKNRVTLVVPDSERQEFLPFVICCPRMDKARPVRATTGHYNPAPVQVAIKRGVRPASVAVLREDFKRQHVNVRSDGSGGGWGLGGNDPKALREVDWAKCY
jgi:hypothetical protein